MRQILYAPSEFRKDLAEELKRKGVPVLAQIEDQFLVESERNDFVWIEAAGRKAEVLRFQSISEAQGLLRARGKLWAPTPLTSFRRSELIAEGLLRPKKKKRRFLEPLPQGPLGAFSLISENELWLAPELTPAVSPGAWDFEENQDAPSRAYLKLWELFTREGFAPKAGESCLELGSAPGGWTWVLAGLGCPITAVDKGEMAPRVLALPGVRWLRQDAFSSDLAKVGPVDWFFSDLICYPGKLLELVQEWADHGRARRFVCTLKFQGETDFEALEAFLRLPGSKALHLHHNKHEVTWFWFPNS
jgi:23S rRNA (cytidine2498-2'-O)-methyltransferase